MPYSDPEAQRRYQREYVARRRREYVLSFGGICSRCKSTDRLQFHHVNPEEKISHRIWSWSDSRIVTELEKCVLLCHECHRAETRRENHWTGHSCAGYKLGCRCKVCKEKKSIALKRERDRKRAINPNYYTRACRNQRALAREINGSTAV